MPKFISYPCHLQPKKSLQARKWQPLPFRGPCHMLNNQGFFSWEFDSNPGNVLTILNHYGYKIYSLENIHALLGY